MESTGNLHEQDTWKADLRSKILAGIAATSPAGDSNAFEGIGYYYHCYAPASLYKYYPDSDLCWSSVENNQMWYSAPSNFNDVFDCNISINEEAVFNEALKMNPDKRGVRRGSKAWRDLHAEIKLQVGKLRGVFDELRNTTGVSCLSESDNSLLMWAHYANHHQGICVEYDLLGISCVLGFTPVPVIYSDQRACFDSLNPQTIKMDVWNLLIMSLTSKSPEWSYENEWRIIRDQNACGARWNASKKGALLDMIQPSSIILGCEVRREFEKKVTEYCSDNEIDLYRMEKDNTYYKLNKKRILRYANENQDQSAI